MISREELIEDILNTRECKVRISGKDAIIEYEYFDSDKEEWIRKQFNFADLDLLIRNGAIMVEKFKEKE